MYPSLLGVPLSFHPRTECIFGNLESNRALVGVLGRADLTLMSLPIQLVVCWDELSIMQSGLYHLGYFWYMSDMSFSHLCLLIQRNCKAVWGPTCPDNLLLHCCSSPATGPRLFPRSRTQAPHIGAPHICLAVCMYKYDGLWNKFRSTHIYDIYQIMMIILNKLFQIPFFLEGEGIKDVTDLAQLLTRKMNEEVLGHCTAGHLLCPSPKRAGQV